MKPYNESITGTVSFRTFEASTSEEEFVWHRDKEDRSIELVGSTDWQFQYDNELPFVFPNDMPIFVPKETFHRVIKGTGTLNLKVTKHI